uniref:EB domain-containing protein n=1 Tax=Timema poppense TaxID=170557 RepID=A0A7R9D134_TIMPO|nr:unnamed protein product [Timema poppensis]
MVDPYAPLAANAMGLQPCTLSRIQTPGIPLAFLASPSGPSTAFPTPHKGIKAVGVLSRNSVGEVGGTQHLSRFAFIKTALASDKSCSANSDCYFLLDSRCISGFCTCDAGLVEEISSEGDKCVPVAVYIREPCKTDPKCSGLGPNSHCILDGNGQGHCECDANNHFLLGKCWRSIVNHSVDGFNLVQRGQQNFLKDEDKVGIALSVH